MLAGAVWVHGDKSCLVCLVVQIGKPRHHRPVHCRPVKGQDNWHRRFRVEALRGVNDVSAGHAADNKGSDHSRSEPPREIEVRDPHSSHRHRRHAMITQVIAPTVPKNQPTAADNAKCCVPGANPESRCCTQLRCRTHCIQSCQKPPAVASRAGPTPFNVQPWATIEIVAHDRDMSTKMKSVGFIVQPYRPAPVPVLGTSKEATSVAPAFCSAGTWARVFSNAFR